MSKSANDSKVALVTGAAQRLGAQIVETLHEQGFNIGLHYRHSQQAALALAEKLNAKRSDSVVTLQADLCNIEQIEPLVEAAASQWGRLDALINNASSFYPNKINSRNTKQLLQQWDELFGSNLRAPFLLSALAYEALAKTHGCIVNIIDIHASTPLKGYSIYCASKAGLAMLTKSLAKEFAPTIRVNGVSPGAILWPESAAEMSALEKSEMLAQIPLGSLGKPEDIADAVLYLIDKADYVTGQIIAVDGGRSL